MAGYAPGHDWWPELIRVPIRIESESAGQALVRKLQWQLVEWRLLADRTADPAVRDALYRNLLAWQELLDVHQPDPGGRCPRCRGRWGRSLHWPCDQVEDVAVALNRGPPRTGLRPGRESDR